MAANKHELKYYDGNGPITNSGTPKAIIGNYTGDNDYSFVNAQNIAGRKMYVKRIEMSSLEEVTYCAIWIQKKGDILTKKPDFSNKNWPTAFDPEYHVMLREYRNTEDSDKTTFKWNIEFSGKGRLVEFDEDQPTNFLDNDITKGGIWFQFDDTDMSAKDRFNVRVWYTDS